MKITREIINNKKIINEETQIVSFVVIENLQKDKNLKKERKKERRN